MTCRPRYHALGALLAVLLTVLLPVLAGCATREASRTPASPAPPARLAAG